MSDNHEEQHEEHMTELKLPETNAGADTKPAPAEAAHSPRVARSASSKTAAGSAAGSGNAGEVRAKGEQGGVKVRPAVRRGTPRARRMNLSLTHLNVWSVAKVSFMMGVAGAIIQIVAVALIYGMLYAVGLFDQINQIVSSTGLNTDGFSLAQVLSLPTVLSATTIFSIVEILLLTLLAVIVAAIYNVVSSLVGGLHITLGDD